MTMAQPVPLDVQALHAVLRSGALQTAFQPIVQLDDGMVRGYEALARFDRRHFTSPAEAFATATAAGLGAELELLAVTRALSRLDDVPAGAWLSLNLSAEALLQPETLAALLAHAHRRIAVEVTEHTCVRNYAALHDVLTALRRAGVLIAVDDMGSGFASLTHTLHVRPDLIKLDISLIRDINADPIRIALTRALVSFADTVGAVLIAEGIETLAEHDQLRSLGVRHGQGYYMAKPGPLPSRHIEPLL
jgi:EAL domain-containing protein (putative c-di-GMP-specific phosphodiesterase class I)